MASPLNQDRLSGVEFEDGGNMSHGQMKDILRKAEKRMRAATKISSPGENDHSFEDTEITQKCDTVSSILMPQMTRLADLLQASKIKGWSFKNALYYLHGRYSHERP